MPCHQYLLSGDTSSLSLRFLLKPSIRVIPQLDRGQADNHVHQHCFNCKWHCVSRVRVFRLTHDGEIQEHSGDSAAHAAALPAWRTSKPSMAAGLVRVSYIDTACALCSGLPVIYFATSPACSNERKPHLSSAAVRRP